MPRLMLTLRCVFSSCLIAIMCCNSYEGITSCRLVWPEDGNQNTLFHFTLWTFFQFIFGLVLPSAIIVVAYIFLFHRLRQLSSSLGHSGPNDQRSRQQQMTLTVIVAVTTFVFCQLPYHVMQVITVEVMKFELANNQRALSHRQQDVFVWISAFSQILVYISSCCNPVIYGITNRNFSECIQLQSLFDLMFSQLLCGPFVYARP